MTPVEQLLSDLVTLLADRELPYAMIGGWTNGVAGMPLVQIPLSMGGLWLPIYALLKHLSKRV
ncbi:hypothetical protein [Adhaeretor mobilis]|uniref:Uncharacterized protein n=1 Tax=Adhaeretor mobilis TaxID=1930276 RepID=A0A517MY94_9BACT|nr:hypothetical protein [Adhaeretor mobilis]QDS99849.1 hypothetical protein HG15A2_31800 [Adhaeretor mobilis]